MSYGRMYITSRRQWIKAIKVIVVYLERIRDVERRSTSYEAELIASLIDEALWLLDSIQ